MDATDQQAPGEQPAGESPSLGQVLEAARSARNLTLEQVSTQLRIETPQLLALEQDQFARIGAPVFVKGYLKQYGQLLGLDYRNLLGLYYDQVDHQEVVIQPSRSIKLRDERQITVWIIAGLVLVVLIVSFVVWWLNQIETPSSASNVATTPVELRRSGIVRGGPVAPPAGGEPVERPAGVDVAAEPVGGAASGDDDRGTAPRASDAPMLGLELSFAQESWAEIVDARGERLFYGLGRAGRRATLSGEPPISVLLGNADGVQLSVDGDDYPIPSGARQRELARFTLAAAPDSD